MFEPKMFIHVPKSAGSMIRHYFKFESYIQILEADKSKHKTPEYTKALDTCMQRIGDDSGHIHARWRDLKSFYKSLTCFAVVRNPWSRVASRYYFAKQVIEREGRSPSYADVSSFDAFLEERYKWGEVEFMWHRAVRGWCPTVDYVCDVKDNLKCDMLRFENLDEDLCSYFNIKEEFPKRNTTKTYNGDYKKIYTPETIQIVADWYKKDIDMWGYDFDTGAQKNYWAKF